MNPVLFRTDEQVSAALPVAVAPLGAGGLLAYPTDTVPGLRPQRPARKVPARA